MGRPRSIPIGYLTMWRKLFFLFLVAAPLASRAPGAPTSRPSQEEMRKKIADLEDRIDRLQTKSAAKQSAVMQEIQADADRHSELMSEVGFFSGYDPDVGFIVQSEDGN